MPIEGTCLGAMRLEAIHIGAPRIDAAWGHIETSGVIGVNEAVHIGVAYIKTETISAVKLGVDQFEGVRLYALRFSAAAGGTAAKLILATGLAGALLFTVSLLSLMKRAPQEHEPEKAPERLQKVPRDDAPPTPPIAAAVTDAYPPQPYSEQEPDSHRPYSRPYEIPHQSGGKAATNSNSNGTRPHGANGTNGLPPAGIPTTPWQPPKNDS